MTIMSARASSAAAESLSDRSIANRLSVTVVDGDVPYPPRSGKRLRTLNLLLPLAHRHEITFIARADPGEAGPAADFLTANGIRPILVEVPLQAKSGSAFYLRLAADAFSHAPYSVNSRFSPALAAAVGYHAARNKIDIWQLEWFGYANCLPPGAWPVILQEHNVESLIWERYGEVETNPAKRAYIALQLAKMLRYERKALHSSHTVVAVSEADAELARKRYNAGNIKVVENGVDAAAYARCTRTRGSRKILFLGALDWRPNVDAIQLLLDKIFPRVREAVPDCTLMIVGRNPSQDLARRVATLAGVELHADVPDVLPYLGASAVLAVPLRIGGGSRLKILEALAAGVPVVASSIGAEGLDLVPGTHFAQADDPAIFAKCLVDAIERPEQAGAAALMGQAFVAAHHDWPVLAGKIEAIWREAAQKTE